MREKLVTGVSTDFYLLLEVEKSFRVHTEHALFLHLDARYFVSVTRNYENKYSR